VTVARSAGRCIALASALAVLIAEPSAFAAARRYSGPADAAAREVSPAPGPSGVETTAPLPDEAEPPPLDDDLSPEPLEPIGEPVEPVDVPSAEPVEPVTASGVPTVVVSPSRESLRVAAQAGDTDVDLEIEVYDEVRDSPEGRMATRRIRGGIMLLPAGGLLVLGAAILGATDPCRRLAGNSCMATARNRGALTMGLTGALIVGAGATLLGIGLHARRRIAAGVQADRRSAGIVLTGRF
jgi:hypothetical protein